MNLIMNNTDGLLTVFATLVHAFTVLLGVYAAARCGKKLVIPAVLAIVAVTFVRMSAHPLSFFGIASMTGLHVAGGYLLGVLFRKRYAPTSSASA